MKRLTSLVASVLTVSTLLAACGSSESGSSPSAGASSSPSGSTAPAVTADAHAEKVAIEVMKIGYGVANTMPKDDGDFVKKRLQEKLNIDLRMTIPSSPDEFNQKLNIRAAGGDLPDLIFFAGRKEYEEYVKKNMLLELTPYADKLKQAHDAIGENMFSRVAISGKSYAYSLNPNNNKEVFWIRKDWLDKLGLPVPTTLDGVIETAKAFVEQDPDGNNKKDTIGITGVLGTLANIINLQHGVTDALYLKDGKMANGLFEPEMKESLAYLQKVLNSGVVDPEIASNKSENSLDKAFQGKAGIILTNWAMIAKDEQRAKWKGVNPNADFVMIDKLQGPKTDYLSSVDISSTSGIVAISRDAAKDETKLNRIFDLINYTASGEGSDLVQFGLEGTHFTKDNGKIVLNKDRMSEIAYTWIYQFAGRPEKDYLSTKFANQAPYIEKNDQIKVLETYNGFVIYPDNYNAADADRFKSEEILKFQYGKNSLDKYDSFLEKLNTTFKYHLYQDSALKQLKDLGYGE